MTSENNFPSKLRENYLMAQALCIAIRELSRVPHPHREVSNIRDMQWMLDNHFGGMAHVIEEVEAVRKIALAGRLKKARA